MGVTGGSYGGFMTNWIHRPHRSFKGGGDAAQSFKLYSDMDA